MSLEEHRLIRAKYRILAEIDRGAFGTVYRAAVVTPTRVERMVRGREHVAVKVAHTPPGLLRLPGHLQHEATMLNLLNRHDVPGVPRLHWYGCIKERTTTPLGAVIVMNHYEQSLKQYVVAAKELELDRVCRLVAQVVRILDHIHGVCVVHRDLKPDNLMMKGDDVHLIDFGLATFYVDGVSGDHVTRRQTADGGGGGSNTTIVGSPLYASYYVHAGQPHVRRDDLIQLGYIFLWLLQGMQLPWQASNHHTTGTAHLNMCMEHKRLANVSRFSAHPGYRHYMNAVYALEFDASPDYEQVVSFIGHT
jgi:serine/threonine protein kinase